MPLKKGDNAPSFMARSSINPSLRLEHLAGRFIVLTFLEGSYRAAHGELARLLRESNSPFDDKKAMHFFVVIGESGEVKDGLGAQLPGHRVYFDKLGEIAALFGVGRETAKPISFLLSPRQQIIDIFEAALPPQHAAQILKTISSLLQNEYETLYGSAPLLRVPLVLEPELCRSLIAWVKPFFIGQGANTSFPSDSLNNQDLRRVIRLDLRLNDEDLQEQVVRRIMNRVMPQVRRAFGFTTEHIDDPSLSLMRALDKSRVDPMREDGSVATAHKRFSLAILLNEGGQGGEFCFPEFGSSLKPLREGEALIYSSHVLREIKEMRQGEQYILHSNLCLKPSGQKK